MVATPPVVTDHVRTAQFELADDAVLIPIVCALGDHAGVQRGSAARVHAAAKPTVQFTVDPDSGMLPRDVFYEALRETQAALEAMAAAMEAAFDDPVGTLSAFEMGALAEQGLAIQRHAHS